MITAPLTPCAELYTSFLCNIITIITKLHKHIISKKSTQFQLFPLIRLETLIHMKKRVVNDTMIIMRILKIKELKISGEESDKGNVTPLKKSDDD